MGRELRRVPLDWEHPKNDRGNWQPQFAEEYSVAADRWLARLAAWEAGEDPDRAKAEAKYNARYFWDWDGGPPDREYYRTRSWTPEEAVGYQLYETTSEGTPLSPIFTDLDELCVWAAEHASTFADFKATAEQWKQMLSDGFVHHTEGRVMFL